MQTEPGYGLFSTRPTILLSLIFFSLPAWGFYDITYTDLNPVGGSVRYSSGTQQVGYAYGDSVSNIFRTYAAIWSGPSHSVIDLNPTGALHSHAYAAAGNQQAGSAIFNSEFHAAIWSGSAASFRDLHPAGAYYSEVFSTSGTQQVGIVSFTAVDLGNAALWYGNATSFVNLTPPGHVARCFSVSDGQQAGTVYFSDGLHAAIWSGTAASFRDLHPSGANASQIFATSGHQQVGVAAFTSQGAAALWSGSPESFISLHPPGARSSEVHATIGTAQAGFADLGASPSRHNHAIIWFGSADLYIDLHSYLPADTYQESHAQAIWSDGSKIIVGGEGVALGYFHPIVWTLTPPKECTLTCPSNAIVCNDPGQCGAVIHFDSPIATNCSEFVITSTPPSGSFFPIGTNTIVLTAVDPKTGQVSRTCGFQVMVTDCEPPAIHSTAATPPSLWPPNHKMQPVILAVSVTDNCDVVRSRIISVSSNGGTTSDWQITGDMTLNLRAERPGRSYEITVECIDNSGNRSIAIVRVAVSH